MTTAHTLQRSLIVGFAAMGFTLAIMGSASGATSTVPDDVVVVSSTQAGSGSFTMTVTNLGNLAVDLDLPAPGAVRNVNVDYGVYEHSWSIDDLAPGAMSTMTGLFLRPL